LTFISVSVRTPTTQLRRWVIASWIAADLALLYYGPKRMSETYYCWWELIYDDEVLAEVRKKIFTHGLDFVNSWEPSGDVKYADLQLPHSIDEIAAKLNRKPTFVAWSLRRLEKRGKESDMSVNDLAR
jgi:hypothetical protein